MCIYICTCRDSIIPVASGGSRGDGDYNNVGLSVSNEDRSRLTTVTGKEEALYTNPEMVIAALNLEVKGHQKRVSMCIYHVLYNKNTCTQSIKHAETSHKNIHVYF